MWIRTVKDWYPSHPELPFKRRYILLGCDTSQGVLGQFPCVFLNNWTNTLSDMDTELAALEARLIKTRAIKQRMMQKPIAGRPRLV